MDGLRNKKLLLLELLQHELSALTSPNNIPLGPPEFMQRYTQDLKCRIDELEGELQRRQVQVSRI